MNLQTKIPLEKQSNNLIDYNSNMLLLGSCFVENIGEKLDYFKIQNTQNPFGVLFHPKAIETLIEKAIKRERYSEDDLFFYNEQWHCFDAHSKLSHASKDNLLNGLNFILEATDKQIQKSSHIVITLGTSWVYRNSENNSIVANCHKVPQKQFKKELLSVDELSESLKNILSLIRSVNYNASVIFTVSPIRHLKDGFVENTQSKAHLVTAIHRVVNNRSFYFPSYEIMMDELRDYRFYSEDMIHPNQTAINYIWEKVKDVWVSTDTLQTMEDVDAIQKGLQHKAFNPQSEAHQKFLLNIKEKQIQLQKKHKHIMF
ncbi:GSCFA domain-containing protein [Thalassobellus suaedae]|uniref:GSCFA domain-containing protein n=1 Tax=Thalassobellus suaedae TaxID=3074124 RepID=A0ABY9XZD9_9FLAO|nr:GSCFA domain-containing protein [Flavobacteriaceae bacterium HL-DH10]